MRIFPSASTLRRWMRLTHLSARQLGGRFFYLVPFAPLLWLALLFTFLVFGSSTAPYTEANVILQLVGVPVAVIAMGLGVRIIASEVDRRTLEIVYTVPGGAHRVWVYKLFAASLILAAALFLCLLVTFVLFTEFGLSTVVGCAQAAAAYLVLGMALAAFFRSEITGTMACLPFLLAGWIFNFTRYSPFFNPTILNRVTNTEEEILAWLVQNRIGMLLAIAAVLALGFSRANRREKMLS